MMGTSLQGRGQSWVEKGPAPQSDRGLDLAVWRCQGPGQCHSLGLEGLGPQDCPSAARTQSLLLGWVPPNGNAREQVSGEQGSDFLHPQGCRLLSYRQTPPISDCLLLAILGGTSGCCTFTGGHGSQEGAQAPLSGTKARPSTLVCA